MGLDQYLFRLGDTDAEGKQDREEVAYWRKANHIHKWFVDQCGDPADDNVVDMPVNLEQLAGLKTTCERVLTGEARPELVLGTKDGFFFGGLDYDEGYLNDCAHTVAMIDVILNTEMWRAEQRMAPGQYIYWAWY